MAGHRLRGCISCAQSMNGHAVAVAGRAAAAAARLFVYRPLTGPRIPGRYAEDGPDTPYGIVAAVGK